MTEALQEYADSRGLALRVDRASGVLRGVKLIGLESLNGRRYRPAALAAAVALYEGAKVNVNHSKEGPLAPRDYRDRLGVVRQVEFREGDGLFGDLHFNPKHPLAEQLAWDAQHNPRNVGFSHNVLARLSRDGEQTVIEAITHVQSVDLVADPAATQGLFEQSSGVVVAQEGMAKPDDIARLERLLAESTAEEDRLRRQLKIRAACDAQGVAPAAGESLIETLGAALYEALLEASDERRVDAMVAERAEALRRSRPLAEHDGRPRSRGLMEVLVGETQRVTSGRELAAVLRER